MDCAYNIITANFSGGKTHATTARVYQWSRGIELCITGADDLPQTFKAHFSVQKRGGVATTIVGIDERVDVPNVLFTIGKDIHVWLGASETADDAEILYTVDIPVAPAPMPEYYDAEDTGVFDAVVEQVSGYAATATAAANSAGASATAAAGSASAAAASASSAAGSAGAAEQARADAVTAKGQAETAAQTATEKALQTAQNASQAALDAGRSESAAERAESAESGAGAAKTAAEAAAQSAAASAATADEKATLAEQSATAAAGSASAAAQSAASIEGDVQIASRKAAEAQTAAGQAVTAKDAAVTAQQGAETAATNAGQSASTATAKASEAAQSASGAAQSKTDAEAAATRAEQAAATLTVDTALSNTSENPVQNKVITSEITDVKTAINQLDGEIYTYTPAVSTDAWTYNNNNAVTSNGDGTYTVGTTDYGTTTWGGNVLIEPGQYRLFGAPGTVFISPNTAYTSAIITNTTGAEKKVTIEAAGMYYVGVRTGSRPSASYTLTPYLLKVGNAFDEIDAELDQLSEDVTDIGEGLNRVVNDNNLITVNADTLLHPAGNATVTFGNGGFMSIRATVQNNLFGLVAHTKAKKTYRLKLKVVTGTVSSIYLCPAAEYNATNYIAKQENVSSGETVDIEFSAVTEQTSVWFNQQYDMAVIAIENIYIGDDILRYNHYLLDYPGTEITVFNKILCIGDSITEGTFNYNQNGSNYNVFVDKRYSYPTLLSKLSGCDVSNYGYGGDTAQSWYNRYQNTDLSGHDACIIMLGINDGVQNVGVENFRSGMTNIINKVKSENNGIRVFVATIIPAYSDYDTKFDAYIAETKRLVEEDFPDAFLIDINKYSECKYYTYYAQGHLTAIGYQELAKEFYTMISYTIHSNLQAFRNVQFIGTNYTYPDFAG